MKIFNINLKGINAEPKYEPDIDNPIHIGNKMNNNRISRFIKNLDAKYKVRSIQVNDMIIQDYDITDLSSIHPSTTMEYKENEPKDYRIVRVPRGYELEGIIVKRIDEMESNDQ